MSQSADSLFKYQTGKKGAQSIGYEQNILSSLPEEHLDAFCGVGNPFSLGKPVEGETILDIGCGAGLDLLFARAYAGETGRYYGVDLSEKMVGRANFLFTSHGISNIQLKIIDSEELPFQDETFDLIISNGVINLSPNKPLLFKEMMRVLKRGGRAQICDIILSGELPSDLIGSVESWSQ